MVGEAQQVGAGSGPYFWGGALGGAETSQTWRQFSGFDLDRRYWPWFEAPRVAY